MCSIYTPSHSVDEHGFIIVTQQTSHNSTRNPQHDVPTILGEPDSEPPYGTASKRADAIGGHSDGIAGGVPANAIGHIDFGHVGW